MTTTHDITALRAAIDQGDDEALLPLADALEEAGDARATGLADLALPPPLALDERCWWVLGTPGTVWLLRDATGGGSAQWSFPFSTRSAAMLALATALAKGE